MNGTNSSLSVFIFTYVKNVIFPALLLPSPAKLQPPKAADQTAPTAVVAPIYMDDTGHEREARSE